MDKRGNVLMVSDVDYTLLDQDHNLSLENRRAIEGLIEIGGHFTVASGRGMPSVKALDLPKTAPALLINGTLIYDFKTDKELWQMPMDPICFDLAARVLEQFPDVGLHSVTSRTNYIIRENAETEFLHSYETLHTEESSLQEMRRDHLNDCLMHLFFWPVEAIPQLDAFIQSQIGPGDPLTAYPSLPNCMTVLNASANKGLALERLADMLDISMERTIAIGDNINDLEFVKRARYGVAVANAKESVKEVADWITTRNHNESAVSQVIERYLNGQTPLG